ncbi:hypothetical protein [Herbaspirillum rubrisubalbicans]|uniref:hypothetical protein n=1 Tax=Herbaspirillum rubrisubalbicans TaxID=80842 RepID=UPI0015C537B2|nr:hypothetical protein [Herbaspirillum rubrisubalbicans]NQE50936.1 hypothetical protein [Herbaspirillum rubrisubalbicans]
MKNVYLKKPRLLLAVIVILAGFGIALNGLIYPWMDGGFLFCSLVLPLILTLHYIVPTKMGAQLIATLATVASLCILWSVMFVYGLFPFMSLPTIYLALFLLTFFLLFASLFLIAYAARITSDPMQMRLADSSHVPQRAEG